MSSEAQRKKIVELHWQLERLRKDKERLIEALEFYADPATYFAIGFFPDPPNGDFMLDFDETELGAKPGKRARATLAEMRKP